MTDPRPDSPASASDQRSTEPMRRQAMQPAPESGSFVSGANNAAGSSTADAANDQSTEPLRRADMPRIPASARQQTEPVKYAGRTRQLPLSTRFNLHHYLLYSISILGVLIVAMLAFGISFFVYQTEARGWDDRQAEAARNAAGTVDQFLHVTRDYMMLAAQLDPAYLRSHPEMLRTLLEQTAELQELVRLDANGSVIASASLDEGLISNLFTFPQSNWFRAARQGEDYFSDVQISAVDEPYMLIAIPAPDGGVVAARLKMTVLWEAVAKIRFGESGLAYIINSEGKIIAHPDTQVVLNHASISNRPEFRAIILSTDTRWHGMYTNFDGVEMIGSSEAIPTTRWTIITEIPRTEAFATTQRAFLVLNSAVLAAGLLMILLVFRLVREVILKPVETLRAGAERIGKGDLSQRIGDIQQTEIGQVALAFNEMAARLENREAALEKARDEAVEASQFKSRLLANVGHDLRTPINAIQGYAEIMSEGVYGPLNEQQRRANDRVLSNARRLLNLINSLLDQAQIEAGKLVLRPCEYNPRELLVAVRETMEIPAQSHGLTLTSQIDPDLPNLLVGDPQRTQQMVMNLVENALKFTQKGDVSVHMFRDGANGWCIAVRDSGPGIPAEAQVYIFDPFRQVDNSPTREQKGVGLGLSIVRQLALLMGGDITLNSEVGQGSTFTIRLPLVEMGQRAN